MRLLLVAGLGLGVFAFGGEGGCPVSSSFSLSSPPPPPPPIYLFIWWLLSLVSLFGFVRVSVLFMFVPVISSVLYKVSSLSVLLMAVSLCQYY